MNYQIKTYLCSVILWILTVVCLQLLDYLQYFIDSFKQRSPSFSFFFGKLNKVIIKNEHGLTFTKSECL